METCPGPNRQTAGANNAKPLEVAAVSQRLPRLRLTLCHASSDALTSLIPHEMVVLVVMDLPREWRG